jgi:hypothetical protein
MGLRTSPIKCLVATSSLLSRTLDFLGAASLTTIVVVCLVEAPVVLEA